MGQTIRNLSTKEVAGNPIFNDRLVVEICEAVHLHYRNLRIILSMRDWVELAKGLSDSLSRHNSLMNPSPKEGTHIELCRKKVAQSPIGNNEIKINLNNNLYKQHEGRIFAEGANLQDPDYIHLKIRDLRLELTHDEFRALTEAVKEANEKLK